MTVDTQEKKATLKAAYSENDFFTTFDFVLPVSGEYEMDLVMDEDVRFIDEYTRECSSQAKMKYSQGALNIHIECNRKQHFTLEVKDGEHTYRAVCCGNEDPGHQIVFTEGIEDSVIDDFCDTLEKGELVWQSK